MTDILGLAALWLGLALAATLLSIWLRIATAMSEIVVDENPRSEKSRRAASSIARRVCSFLRSR